MLDNETVKKVLYAYIALSMGQGGYSLVSDQQKNFSNEVIAEQIKNIDKRIEKIENVVLFNARRGGKDD